MIKIKQLFIACVIVLVSVSAVAQNNTNSPYTRYGLGDLSGQNFVNTRAMGGLSYAVRDGLQINATNPASYTAVDSLTFLFDGGLTLQNMNINDNGEKLNVKNSSFDYLAMQFRLSNRLAMSIGLLPFSNVGYNMTQAYPATETTPNSIKQFTGDGGTHQFYGGLGVKLFKNLSLGLNFSYFWGDINRSLTMIYPVEGSQYSYIQQTNTSISDYKLDFGVQYICNIDEKNQLIFGGVFSPKHKLNNSTTRVVQSAQSKKEDLDVEYGLPTSFGLGVNYIFNQSLMVGVDYTYQKWSDVKFMNEKIYADLHKISLGAQYVPNINGRSFVSRVRYRFGAYYSNPYYKINGDRACREFGASFGFGLPVPRSRSIINISGGFSRVKGLETNMVNENIFKVSIGLTFNGHWFFKRKVN